MLSLSLNNIYLLPHPPNIVLKKSKYLDSTQLKLVKFSLSSLLGTFQRRKNSVI